MTFPQPPPQHRHRPARRLVAAAALLVAGAVLVGLAANASRERRPAGEPASSRAATPTTGAAAPTTAPPRATAPGGNRGQPIGGVALQAPTGLRLLVADVPAPFVLDVDRGTATPVTGLPRHADLGIGLLPVGEDALVLAYRLCDRCPPDQTVYLVRRGSAAAIRLGTSLQATPARDGRGVWMLRQRDEARCTIGQVGLDGRPRRAARPIRCDAELVAELAAGLLIGYAAADASASYSALVKPGGRSVRLPGPQPTPVVGDLVLSGAGPNVPLVLADTRSGARHRLSWPSRPDYHLGEVTGDPNGRLAVVEFANAGEQRLDIWLLDTTTRRWRHLPGMPVRVAPKAAHVQWTADGRVVLLAGGQLAVWRPGEPRFAVRQVKPPRQPDRRFVIW